ncbi:MAG: hypothetical protein ACHBMF_02900 [Chromatiales bacterium]
MKSKWQEGTRGGYAYELSRRFGPMGSWPLRALPTEHWSVALLDHLA